MAPSAAVISSALVTSKGNTYLVKMRAAIPPTFADPKFGPVVAAGPIAACPTIRLSSTSSPIPATPAASRCPLIVSMTESAEVTPTIMRTKRKIISTAPV